jgi:electron transfer flavoprotein alpha subunit
VSNRVVITTIAPATEAGDLLTLGRGVAEALGGELVWLHLGPANGEIREAAAAHGVARVDCIEDPKIADCQPDAVVEAVAQYCAAAEPRVLLFPQTFDVRLIAPRVAARIGAGVVMNTAAIEAQADGALAVTASAYGGDTRRVYEVAASRPCVASVLPNAIEASPAAAPTTPEVAAFDADLGAVEERIRVVERARAEGPRLDSADVIVAGGRGLGAPENYKLIEELAAALGGLPGASRPIVDDGWVDSSHQVGLTGTITRPGLYLAAGISGASQHMAGCSAAKVIVAINTDAEASIFRYARYGVVGSCLEVLPELIRAARS